MSKSINLVTALLCCLTTVFAQQQIAVNSAPAPEGYDISVEVVNENIGILVGALGVTDLTGYSTTHLYVTMDGPDDFLSSVSGDVTNPTYINSTTNFYNAALGAGVPMASTACSSGCPTSPTTRGRSVWSRPMLWPVKPT